VGSIRGPGVLELVVSASPTKEVCIEDMQFHF
jgi:hypothetical protein